MIEYIIMFIIETNFTENIHNALDHFKLCAMRTSIVKYDLLFTIE